MLWSNCAVVMDTPLVISSSGLRPLLNALLSSPPSLSLTLLHPLLYISSFPQTRRFLYPSPPVRGPSALLIVLSDLTNVLDPVKGEGPLVGEGTEEGRLRGNARVIAGMMGSWTGLLALCALSGGSGEENEVDGVDGDGGMAGVSGVNGVNGVNGVSGSEVFGGVGGGVFGGVRSLVDAMRVKSLIVRDILLDLWFEVLNIRIGSWGQNFLAGRRLTGTNPRQPPTTPRKPPQTPPSSPFTPLFPP